MNPRRSIRRRGFTLIELILAMLITAMLAACLYGTMHSALQARRAARDAIEPTREASITTDLLRQDFDGVLPPTGLLAGAFTGTHQPGQSGMDNDTVVFYSIGKDDVTNPAAQTTSGSRGGVSLNVRGSGNNANTNPMSEGIRKVELLVRTDVNPSVLVRRITRNLLPTTLPPPDEEVLCRDVRSFSLRYFDGTTWQTDWDSTTVGDVLPLAVSITIELNDPNAATGEPSSRRSQRVIPMSCGKLEDTSTTTAQ